MEDWRLRPARDLHRTPGERLRSLDRESGLISSGLHFAWWTAVRGYLAVWHRLSIRGRERLPVRPPFVLVANHTSHLDALVLASPLPWQIRDRVFPIAAGEVFFETHTGAALSAGFLNALPMWRKRCGGQALQQLRQRLVDEPCAYVLFPEGTRSRDGTLAPFKSGLGMLVAETDVPVIPCYLDGCFEALHPAARWPRPRSITLHVGEPLAFASVGNHREGWLSIAAAAESGVRQLAAQAEAESRRPAASP